MIWFHGGGWVTGAGNFDFYGPKFLLDHEVILVTVNFRYFQILILYLDHTKKIVYLRQQNV